MSGPMSGASTTRGANVSARYPIVRGRAAPIETLKNNEPASETVKNASAAVPSAWAAESRANGMAPNMRRRTGIGVSGPIDGERRSSPDRRQVGIVPMGPRTSSHPGRLAALNATLVMGIAVLARLPVQGVATPDVVVRHDKSLRRQRSVVALVATSIAFTAVA